MIKNYLLTAFRNVLRYKGFSLINIFGLSLSMSVCMLIIVVIMDQYAYDDMPTKKDQIYRIQQVDSLANIGLRMGSNPYVIGTELRDKYAIAEECGFRDGHHPGRSIYCCSDRTPDHQFPNTQSGENQASQDFER
jgi:putative ABC transport system permease protein